MNEATKRVRTTYLTLLLLSTLSASFIWGINTLFLLDAGLTNTEAFAANAFFTLGQVLFEVPTGVVADTWGRRVSFLLGSLTLLLSTLLYLYMWQTSADFWQWAIASALIGLGFSFFSGAVEAWLVDALDFTGFKGSLEGVFAQGQIITGVAMLSGSVAGGYIAQATNLGVPYILRSALLGLTFLVAFVTMRDLGFKPRKSKRLVPEIKLILKGSIDHGLRNRPVRWLMLAAPFTTGVSFYAFYAMQPYLLELYGDPSAYGIAGLAAAILACAQITGGLLVPSIRKRFQKRTSVLILGGIISVFALAIIGLSSSFWLAIAMLVAWAIVFSATSPVRQAFINSLIPSKQRATVLSFDTLMGYSGAVPIQPALGRVADINGYAASYLVSSGIQALSIPFVILAKKEKVKADDIGKN